MNLLEEGALPGQVDAALKAFGMTMGPFAAMDLTGSMLAWKHTNNPTLTKRRNTFSLFLDRLVCRISYQQVSTLGITPTPRAPTAAPLRSSCSRAGASGSRHAVGGTLRIIRSVSAATRLHQVMLRSLCTKI